MAITLDGTNGITTPDITSTAGFDSADLTGDIAAARITNALNATGSAPIYACRAWVNFNGTGTPAIRASGNVSSITDNGTGAYTINFTTAMSDANYALTACGRDGVNAETPVSIRFNIAPTASACAIQTTSGGGSGADFDFVLASVFR
jgi:hypothetical protein